MITGVFVSAPTSVPLNRPGGLLTQDHVELVCVPKKIGERIDLKAQSSAVNFIDLHLRGSLT